MKEYSVWQKYWLSIRLLLLVAITTTVVLVLHDMLFDNYTNEYSSEFLTWTTLIIEVAVGIGITFVIHNHARKTQLRTDADLELTITGTYYALWNLYMSSKPYVKSIDVRNDKIPGLQIASMINSIQMNLPRCGQKIKSDEIETLQLHLILMHNVIRASIDPRADSEEYWKKNGDSFTTAVKGLREISVEFEPFLPDSCDLDWGEDDI